MADLIQTLQQAGFQGDALRKAWAIVQRESGGNPRAFNGNTGTGDRSFGLFQINTLGNLASRIKQFGLSSEQDLFDPLKNARAAFKLSKGGTDFGAWGIGPNAYKGAPATAVPRFQQFYNSFPDSFPGSFPGAVDQSAAPPAVPTTLASAPAAEPVSARLSPFVGSRTQRLSRFIGRGSRSARLAQFIGGSPSSDVAARQEPTPDPAGGFSVAPTANVKDVQPQVLDTARRFGLTVTSGYRSVGQQRQIYSNRSAPGSVGAPGRSYHNFGRAIDVRPDSRGLAFLKFAFANPGLFKEVFYDPAGASIKNGRVIKSTIGGHADHIHIAL